ncbi:hypothetical protein [Symbiopectobacterium purcellii]|uniref:Uncharacterized protein n=1 Tax=Symbiopectobacterium purcellii TaxID=2871826 RepID=A0ABX9ASM8_9ENTR|nr:hypothetical protein [Symbiopectobacterium purcellii]QZN96795.1 hypothetical protein K6K13_05105 [Symbiopectobacterium purcellii]
MGVDENQINFKVVIAHCGDMQFVISTLIMPYEKTGVFMHAIADERAITPSIQLHENLMALSKSVKGIIPDISTTHVNDILQLTISPLALAWNWSKGFNYKPQ